MAGGIFCIENWAQDLRNRETVRPLLDYLRNREVARVVHQRIDTERELRHYLSRFAALRGYTVGYLAMHGKRGHVWVGSRALTLEKLARWERLDEIRDEDDRASDEHSWHLDLSGKALHLGSCGSLRVSPSRLAEFRSATGAAAICGYKRHVDWIDAGAADLMILAALAYAADGAPANFARALRAVGRRADTMFDALGFVSEPDWSVPPRLPSSRHRLDVAGINLFLQNRLRDRRLPEVSAVEAARWLEEADLLRDSPSRPGLPLRGLLRNGQIRGGQQRLNQRHGRWFISRK